MGNENAMAGQSAWFRQYEKEVNGTRNAGNGKKKILIILPILIFGGLIAMMIKNGALENEQTKGGVYALAGICAFMVLMMLILISKSKKIDAAAITRNDLNQLLTTPEAAAEFDAQMKAKPLFQVTNQKDNYVFATKDYVGMTFKHLGDQTYRFIRLRDVVFLHTIENNSGTFAVEFRDGKRKLLMTWVAEKEDRIGELKAALVSVKQDVTSEE